MPVGLPLHPVDRAFLALERKRPDVRWDAGGIVHLEGPPPTLADFRAHVGARLPRLPFLTHRLDRSRRPAWRPDEEFSLERHVHEAMPDRPEDGEPALDAALRVPLPRDAPWGIWLLHGHAPDRYTLCYRFEHVCQDGVAAALAFRVLLGDGAPAVRPLPPPPRRRDLLRRVVAATGFGAKLAYDAVPLPGRRPDTSFVPAGRPYVVRAGAPLDRLRAIGEPHGASANDVHLAALAGATAAWSRESGVTLPRLSALLPVDARRHEEEQTWGNRCFAVPLRLPLSGTPPLRRLQRIASATAKVKRPGRRQAIQDLVRFMPVRPTEWYMRCVTSPRVTGVTATSVRLVEPGGLGGARVSAISLLPLCFPGHLFSVGLAFAGDRAEVAFVTDHALPMAERLPGLWSQALDRLEKDAAAARPGRCDQTPV